MMDTNDLIAAAEQAALAKLTARVKWVTLGILALLVAMGAYLFGVHTSTPTPEITAPAVAQSQADGSLVLARQLATPAQAAKPPHTIPKGSTEERRMGVKLKPPAFDNAEGCRCDPPPVEVNLSLVRQGDGRRVIASSPTGTVLAGLDMPIEAGAMPTPHPWAAGVSYDPLSKGPGLWVERDLGRIRVGAEALRDGQGKLQGRVRVGWAW